MSDLLTRIVMEVSGDPARLARYRADPEREMAVAGLSEEERAALRSSDCSTVREAMRDSTIDLVSFLAGLLAASEQS